MMRFEAAVVVSLALLSGGCAAAFRDPTAPVLVTTEPADAAVTLNGNPTTRASTPAKVPVKRAGLTRLDVAREGYELHTGVVKKRISVGYLLADIGTCVIPVALCIPLIADLTTQAWYEPEPYYAVRLVKAEGGASPAASRTEAPAAPRSMIPATEPPSTMSDSERKSAARAAFQEGVSLLEKGQSAEALARFQTAQKLFDAPTHVYRIGQSLAMMGKLVDAQEVFEVLSRRELGANAAEAFREAQESGKRDLEKLRPRIPTLRIQIKPQAASLAELVVRVNGAVIPNELVGIGRPVDPGRYTVQATARGKKPASSAISLEEGAAKTVELELQ